MMRYLFATLLFTSCVLAGAASADIGDGLFPEARMVYRTTDEQAGYNLALGPLKKVNNQWRSERERRVSGRLLRRTLEIPERYAVDEVQEMVRAELQRHNARPLFTCGGLDCGSSNAWANNFFEIKQLYGLDQNQYYGVWEVATDQDLYYVTTYVVQRGNQRIYLQVDRIEVPEVEEGTLATSPTTLVESLKREGYFVLAGVRWTADGPEVEEKHLAALVNALQRDPWLKVRVVGHDYGAGGLDKQQERSRAAAEQVRKALLELGVKPARLTVHGLGSLAPAGRRGSARLEIVAQ